MNIQREKLTLGVPVWHHDKSTQVMIGGFTLNVTGFPTGTIISDATPLIVDEDKRTATFIRSALVSKAVTTADTSIEIKKGSLLIVGDKINGKEITAIDKTNTTHDVLTLAAAYGKAVKLGEGVSTGDGNGLLYGAIKVTVGNTHPVTVGVGGLVYARRIVGYVSEGTKANLPNIIFSNNK